MNAIMNPLPADGSTYSLLVVDDENRARRHVIEDINWEPLKVGPIYEAADGRMALEMLERHHPDLMILDIRMPHMDGVSLVDLLSRDGDKAHGSLKEWLQGNIPMVIALSGYSDFEAARRMLSSGIVVDYLLKPASEDQLFEAVYKCIDRIDLRRGMQDSLETAMEDDAVALEAMQTRKADRFQAEPAADDPANPNVLESRGGSQTQVKLIEDVKKYLQENYHRKLTLSMAAEHVHINASYLSRLFNEVEGIGFSDYLSMVRIDHAKELLQDYYRKIYEVADAVGYQDVKHFLKVFKKQTGMTPSEYREKSLLEF